MGIFDIDNYIHGPSADVAANPLNVLNPMMWPSLVGQRLFGQSGWTGAAEGAATIGAGALGAGALMGAGSAAGAAAGVGSTAAGSGAAAAASAAASGGGTSWGALMAPSLIGSGFNYFSQQATNEQNRQIAQDQMNFQANMSNTAHQREVRDLEAAGLNPVLSAGGGGSSTPSGAGIPMQAPQVQLPDLMAGYVSMQQLGIAQKQLEQTDAKINIDRLNSASQIAKNATEADLNKTKKVLSEKEFGIKDAESNAAGFINRGLQAIKNVQDYLSNPQGQMTVEKPIELRTP